MGIMYFLPLREAYVLFQDRRALQVAQRRPSEMDNKSRAYVFRIWYLDQESGAKLMKNFVNEKT